MPSDDRFADEPRSRRPRVDDEDAPRRRPRDDDDDEVPRRRRKQGGGMSVTTILLIIGGVLCLLCLIGGGVAGTLVYVAYQGAKQIGDEMQKEMNAGLLPPGVGKVILSQQGRLQRNDPVKDLKPHKAFKIALQKGKLYVIDMVSNDFDSFLRLYDPRGILVASDDDSGGFPNARIHYRADQTGTYEISATVFDANQMPIAGGGFNVTVREEKD